MDRFVERELAMRVLTWFTCGMLVVSLTASQPSVPGTSRMPASPAKAAPAAVSRTSAIEVVGLTQCAPGHRGSIAPVPLHPVVQVKVAPGDRVKKGQELVKLDDDEPRADVRLKRALLDSARHSANEARRFLAKAQSVPELLPEQRLHEARLALRKTEADERAAKASLDSSEAELEHYSVTAVVDGVVSWLDVYPGVVSRPGTTVWGEIVDLRELDVRCELTPEQADRLAVGQDVEVRRAGGKTTLAGARLAFVSPVADSKSGLVPVLVRLPNPEERLRCGVPVAVRFTSPPAALCKK
jgi:RND family efflux transporter MFP subunit